MNDWVETCSACKATGPGMQNWSTSVGEMCETCYQGRYPEEYARELEAEAIEDSVCESCGRPLE